MHFTESSVRRPSNSPPRPYLSGLVVAAFLALLAASAPVAAQDGNAKLLLYPDIHRDFVVFVHGEDLWRAPSAGGTAQRLTSHPGEELFPKVSPDGQWIAFSAQYSGSRQVWVMPAEGGTPKQLTYYTDVGEMPPRGGFDYWIQGWTPDGKILVRANRTPWGERMGRYYLVDPAGGLETPLAPPHGGSASFSPDGAVLVYTPIDREFRTWKHSMGGRAQDIWTYDVAAEQSTRLTDYRGTDNFPMWVDEDTIYFTSDRSYTLEIFALERAGAEWTVRQVTGVGVENDWDVLWPSQGPDSLVFLRGGALYAMSYADESVRRIDIQIAGDHDQRAPRFENVADDVQSGTLSPSGKRVLLSARGDIFSVPAEHGPTRNLTRTQGVREHAPAWSPDGRWIAYLSDATGEYEIYLQRHGDGTPETKQLTTGGSIWKFAPVWSADSKRLAWGDRGRKLWVMDTGADEPTLVDTMYRGDPQTYAFSPDGRWLVYTRTDEQSRGARLSLYSLDDGTIHRLGDGLTSDFSPAFSADGKYLFFVSNRDFNLRFSALEFDYVYDRAARIYVAALDPEAPALFPPRSDEEAAEEKDATKKDETDTAKGDAKDEEKKDEEKKADVGDAEPEPVQVDPEGFVARTVAVPGIPAGAYAGLVAAEGALYYAAFGQDGPPRLDRYDLEKRKADQVTAGLQGFELSADGKKILVQRGADWHVIDAKAGANGEGKLDLSGLRTKIDPVAEWRQVFEDGWRIARDFFYDPNMHGMDWDAIGDRYRALLPHVSDRSELDFLFGELVGELAAGHTYVGGGDVDDVERVAGGMLGAEFEADASGRYRIARILDGENWDDDFRSPLTEPGVDLAEGTFLLAIDGEDLTTADNPYRLLEGKANTQVTLTVHDQPTTDGARDVVVHTIADEGNLRYIDWVKSRMRMVDEMSGGRIGYIHLPNTAVAGNRMLQKMFYAQATKDALIVDDRYNGGGFIPDQMIEYLQRNRLAYWAMRDIDSMRTPGFAHDGPKVMLMNGYSSSGGDALPYFFRKVGLGDLIGTRTWGGLIGLTGGPQLVDGGAVSVCTFRIYDENGEWVVENEGVVPDHEVFDTAEGLLHGDPSIEKAVELLLQQLDENPPTLPAVPTPPDLSRRTWTGGPAS